MPSKKPQILIRTSQELIDKLDIIAEKDSRSRSNLAEKIIIEYVEKYEQKNGNITIGDITQKGNNNTIRIGN